jgi:pyrroline-5-carboxylate reductase
MGGALLKSWRSGSDAFTIVDPDLDPAPQDVEHFRSGDAISDRQFDVVVVAIKPQLVEDVLPEYQNNLAPDGYILSIAAGCSIARLKAALSGSAIVRVMPNLPAAIGKGVSGLCASDAASDAHIAHATDMMGRVGSVIRVKDEDALDRFTAIAGSGPGYVFEIARTLVEATTNLGFTEKQGTEIVLALLEGTIAMAKQSELSLEELRQSVTSKNGTTAAGLDALNGKGQLGKLMSDTLEAAYRRAIELR